MNSENQLLNQELHARPGINFSVPSRWIHVLLQRPDSQASPEPMLRDLLGREPSFESPESGDRYRFMQDGSRLLGLELHTESYALTMVEAGQAGALFSRPLSEQLSAPFLQRMHEDLITGLRIEVVDVSVLAGEDEYLWAQRQLDGAQLVGGWMSDRHASVWTDYRPDADCLIRVLVIGHQLTPGRLGRLVHRLSDIDDYRIMAQRGLPVVQGLMRELNEVEPRLDAVMALLAREPGASQQEELLTEITRISARVEHMIARSAYRFSASRAYAAIVEQRFKAVGEEVQQGHLRLTIFLKKTLGPAMRTCEAAEQRAQSIAERISRAAHVLNTMVDLQNKRQNQSILRSMEQQARMQVTLQMAVEGLSIVAISYYGTGLVNYLLKSAAALGLPVDAALYTGLSIPLVVLVTWFGVRLAKKKLKLLR